eukprot:11631435-Alexandrium_andersonii.AAC.1
MQGRSAIWWALRDVPVGLVAALAKERALVAEAAMRVLRGGGPAAGGARRRGLPSVAEAHLRPAFATRHPDPRVENVGARWRTTRRCSPTGAPATAESTAPAARPTARTRAADGVGREAGLAELGPPEARV